MVDNVIQMPRRRPRVELRRKPPKPKIKKRVGNVAMRRALAALGEDADIMEACLDCINEVASHDPDPRAVATLIEHWGIYGFDPFESREECDRFATFVAAFMTEYVKRFPLPKPRLVTE